MSHDHARHSHGLSADAEQSMLAMALALVAARIARRRARVPLRTTSLPYGDSMQLWISRRTGAFAEHASVSATAPHTPAQDDDDQERRARLLLLGIGAVLAQRLIGPAPRKFSAFPRLAIDNLRLAHATVTTRWAGLGGRRLDVRDGIALNRAYGATRLGPAVAPRATAR